MVLAQLYRYAVDDTYIDDELKAYIINQVRMSAYPECSTEYQVEDAINARMGIDMTVLLRALQTSEIVCGPERFF